MSRSQNHNVGGQDCILSRSYSKVCDAIVGATRGEDFSHAVIYVTPAELWDTGELLYMSGGREEVQAQAAAQAYLEGQESSL